MPPRRRPTPKSKQAQLVIDLVAGGDHTLVGACEKAGLGHRSVWSWIQIAKGNIPGGRPPSQQHLDACADFGRKYDKALEERDEVRVHEALKSIRTAATEGFDTTKVRRKSVAGQIVEEVREATRTAPSWQAAAWTAERLRPEKYSRHSKVELSGGIQLRPGEADQVAAECTDEEAEAIDRGDVRVLAVVLARVRDRSVS